MEPIKESKNDIEVKIKILPSELGHYLGVDAKYKLRLCNYRLQILSRKDDAVLHSWHFVNLREYGGTTKGKVQLHMGRHCSLGEGFLDVLVTPAYMANVIKEKLHIWAAELANYDRLIRAQREERIYENKEDKEDPYDVLVPPSEFEV